MDNFISLMTSIIDFWKVPFTIWGFTFSFWGMFITLSIFSICIWFIVNVFSD